MKKKTFGFVVALLLVGAGLFAQVAQPGVVRATLENGLRVVVVPDTLAPVATIVVNYLVGSEDAPPGFPGLAHAQEHMMFRGSPGLTADQLSAIGAEMGGDFNADTTETVTQYFFTVPAEDVDVALHLEAIRMAGALDTEALWQQERGAIEQEVARDLSNPEYLLFQRLQAEFFKGTVFEHDALGTKASFDLTTGAMLRRFHETWYVPNNAILVVAGNVDPAQVVESVRTLFGPIPSRPVPARPSVSLGPVSPQQLALTTDRPYGMAVAAFRMPGSTSPDFAAATILADVLSSQRGALEQMVVDGQALFAGFSLGDKPPASIGYAIAGFPAGSDGAKVLDQVKQILADIAAKGAPADLVDAARRRELAAAEFARNSISSLAFSWSQALAVYGLQSPDEELAAISKVTKADVDRAARQYLDFGHAITAVLTPRPSGAPVASSGFGGQESFSAAPSGTVTLPTWASDALAKLTVPPSTVNPQVSVLANGITLIVQPETISNTVTLVGRIDSNPLLLVPDGKEGLATLTNSLFDYGTTSLDRVAFQTALDDIAADVSAGTDFSLSCLTDSFERALQLLADNELHPSFPESAFRVQRGEEAASVAGQMQSPSYKLSRALFGALLPPKDPELRQTTPATVQAITPADVRSYYATAFRPDMTTIVIVGNISADRARAAVQASFGSWKATGPKPPVLLPPVPDNKAAMFTVPDPSRTQDQVSLTETVGLTTASPDRYALELGNRVLGGGFFTSWLYRDLREQTGLVYTVGSGFDIGRTRSLYSIEFGADPANVSKAIALIRQDLARIQSQPVSAGELDLAKALLLRETAVSEGSVDAIAGGLLDRAVVGLPLDEPTRAATIYLGLTAGQVRDAFAKWVRPADFVQATLGPAPR
jgi:zinc protease